ncbi:maternal protein exuperantia-2 [Drosophila pseudoobscura]|uniref:Maternal protein exuperantia-2 n=1 Tax=Drosophila pseudoobscura pseudoobscura TaxID=46245 RepID=A0A6I8VHI8_DROPS|nr:maternal protein exuperantia-2 [Drosophila pseudoobscura]XP_015041520.2 maternal protein exuperantia-2 [Drosophila pseudoobscura]XP_015041521.2 maternal protein exuperantia-2 [Drosophila pseudoobscura]
MVSAISEDSASATASGQCEVVKEELPAGNYILVAVEIDTTGRRLIDEIVQLAGYTSKGNFQQYIMPYMNLNQAARQRHQIRVISIGFYRMLKSMQTYKIIKSKSEVAALMDFLNWLETLLAKQPNKEGIVMLYHDDRKFIPYMILEALKKYSLIDRFNRSVKAFANTCPMAKTFLGKHGIKNCGLRKLSMLLAKSKDGNSTKEDEHENPEGNSSITDNSGHKNQKQGAFEGSANVRAKMVYEMALQLIESESTESPESFESPESSESSEAEVKLLNAVRPFSQLLSSTILELKDQNHSLGRQNSFRPVFLNYFRTTLNYRVRAVKYRIALAEHGFTLKSLKAIWSDKRKPGLELVLTAIDSLKTEETAELLDLLDSYYDPSKTTIKPRCKRSGNGTRRRNRAKGAASSKNGAIGAGGDNSVPDSATKPGGRPRRKRNNIRNNILGPQNTEKGSPKAEMKTSTPKSMSIKPPSEFADI